MWNQWNGDNINTLVENACVRAVDKTGHVILTAAKQQVPLDEGFLLRSGIVIIKHKKIPIAIISFGGGPGTGHPKIPYALRWHETQANFQHGRKWKYLKDPYSRLGARTLILALQDEIGGIL